MNDFNHFMRIVLRAFCLVQLAVLLPQLQRNTLATTCDPNSVATVVKVEDDIAAEFNVFRNKGKYVVKDKRGSLTQITTKGSELKLTDEVIKTSEIDFRAATDHLNIHHGGEVAGSQFNGEVIKNASDVEALIKSEIDRLAPDGLRYDQFNRAEITLTIPDGPPVGYSGVANLDDIKRRFPNAIVERGMRTPGGKPGRIAKMIKDPASGRMVPARRPDGSIETIPGFWYPKMVKDPVSGLHVVAKKPDGTIIYDVFEPHATIVKIPKSDYQAAAATRKLTVVIEKGEDGLPTVKTIFPGENAPSFPAKVVSKKEYTLPSTSRESQFWDEHVFVKMEDTSPVAANSNAPRNTSEVKTAAAKVKVNGTADEVRTAAGKVNARSPSKEPITSAGKVNAKSPPDEPTTAAAKLNANTGPKTPVRDSRHADGLWSVDCVTAGCREIAEEMENFFGLTYGRGDALNRTYVKPSGLDDLAHPEKVVTSEFRVRNKKVTRLDKDAEGGMHWVFSNPDNPDVAIRVLRPDMMPDEIIPFSAGLEVGLSHILRRQGLPAVRISASADQLQKGITVAERINVSAKLTNIKRSKLPATQRMLLDRKLAKIKKRVAEIDPHVKEFVEKRGGFIRKQQKKVKVKATATRKAHERTISKEIGVDYHPGQVAFEKVDPKAISKMDPRDREWVVWLTLPPNKKPHPYKIWLLDF